MNIMEADSGSDVVLSPGSLRRLKVFADMAEEQIALFVELVEPLRVKANRVIAKRDEPGDSMYLLLDGNVRVSEVTDGRETILATLETGDFFGEVCLFADGLRTADVVAIRDCTLLKITSKDFDAVLAQHPDVAALFLRSVLRVVVSRIRTMDKKYLDSMLLSRFWNQRGAPLAK